MWTGFVGFRIGWRGLVNMVVNAGVPSKARNLFITQMTIGLLRKHFKLNKWFPAMTLFVSAFKSLHMG
jgi:hypothetical protein